MIFRRFRLEAKKSLVIPTSIEVMEEQASRRLASAFDSPTFGEDGSFQVDKPVGSMSISPCGRDVVLASYVIPTCTPRNMDADASQAPRSPCHRP